MKQNDPKSLNQQTREIWDAKAVRSSVILRSEATKNLGVPLATSIGQPIR